MPRQPRRKDELCLYHVILRGNERKKIFERQEDKRRFLITLGKTKEKYNYLIHAYCIMDNHAHLIINSNGNDISQLMKSINVSYAYYYNHKYNRCGHLFQDRFKSERIDDDTYFIQLSKYIHKNPVKAGIVKEAVSYYWSSFRAYMKKETDNESLVETDKLLSLISRERYSAITEYAKFVSEKDDIIAIDIEEEYFPDVNDQHISITGKEEAEQEILRFITERNIVKDQIYNSSISRNELIKEIRRKSNLTLKEIGELFGGLCESRVSKILKL